MFLPEKLGNSDHEMVGIQSELESIITLFSKNRELRFEPGNGWADVLQLLVTLRLPRSQLYNTFQALVSKYVVRSVPFCFWLMFVCTHEGDELEHPPLTHFRVGARWRLNHRGTLRFLVAIAKLGCITMAILIFKRVFF